MHDTTGSRLRAEQSQRSLTYHLRSKAQRIFEFRVEPCPVAHGLRMVRQPGHGVIV